ncbi:hypothetical protein KUH03_11375 [Sphingobacterium sp. E70]|uniref:hypothetical protein n=1 Tax=Sphingobacterium sp. E70 TaxID=2853439 RepID=UPI00211CF21C|nr:hypothetical protein [Sphingobacterium sp. E70]ULT27299.1 hypothetical protein KUH03_11375 [Sphingobacterium sp. E70]
MSCKESDKLVANDVLKAKALANGTASGTTYYVDPSGSDDSVGTSAGSAWKTLAKINASVFSPGTGSFSRVAAYGMTPCISKILEPAVLRLCLTNMMVRCDRSSTVVGKEMVPIPYF